MMAEPIVTEEELAETATGLSVTDLRIGGCP